MESRWLRTNHHTIAFPDFQVARMPSAYLREPKKQQPCESHHDVSREVAAENTDYHTDLSMNRPWRNFAGNLLVEIVFHFGNWLVFCFMVMNNTTKFSFHLECLTV